MKNRSWNREEDKLFCFLSSGWQNGIVENETR